MCRFGDCWRGFLARLFPATGGAFSKVRKPGVSIVENSVGSGMKAPVATGFSTLEVPVGKKSDIGIA